MNTRMTDNHSSIKISGAPAWILSEIRNKSVLLEYIPADLETFDFIMSSLIPWSDNWDVISMRKKMLAAYLRMLEKDEFIEISRTPEYKAIKKDLPCDLEISKLDYFQDIKVLAKGWEVDIDYKKLKEDLPSEYAEISDAVEEGRW